MTAITPIDLANLSMKGGSAKTGATRNYPLRRAGSSEPVLWYPGPGAWSPVVFEPRPYGPGHEAGTRVNLVIRPSDAFMSEVARLETWAQELFKHCPSLLDRPSADLNFNSRLKRPEGFPGNLTLKINLPGDPHPCKVWSEAGVLTAPPPEWRRCEVVPVIWVRSFYAGRSDYGLTLDCESMVVREIPDVFPLLMSVKDGSAQQDAQQALATVPVFNQSKLF